MKKIIFALVIVVFAFSSCKKETSKCLITCKNGGHCDETTGDCICAAGFKGLDCSVIIQQCETNHWGSVRVNSSHSDEYYIYINGTYVGSQYYGSVTYNYITPGNVTVQELQASYVFLQNTYTQTGNLSECGTLNATF